MLELKKMTRTFEGPEGRVSALADVSMRLTAGELVSVQGPSGCGKTTLLLAAGTLLRPSAGTVEIDGVDPYGLSAEKRSAFRSRKIGFVFQQFHLIPYLNILENIVLPTTVTGTSRQAAEKKGRELIERFNLTHRLKHKPGELSAGEKQRTGLARAMINQPSYILADEPTGNLDPDNAQIVLDALKQYTAASGAVLLVTHDPQAATHADRTIRLNQGRLVEA